MPFKRINGRNVHYQLHNPTSNPRTDETVIFVHSNAVDLRAYDSILKNLDCSYPILRYDLRGYGKSENEIPINELTIQHFIMDLHDLIDALDLKSVHLVGWQLGALISAGYAAQFPTMVKTVMLMAMPCHPPHMIESIRTHRRELSANQKEIPFDYLEAMATTLQKGHPELKRLREYAKGIEFELYVKAMDLSVSADPITPIKQISCPVLILSGAKERLFPFHYLKLHTVHIPHCHHLIIPNAASFIVLEQPKLIAQIIDDFVTEQHDTPAIKDSFIQDLGESMLEYVNQIQNEWLHKLHAHKQLQVKMLGYFRVTIQGKPSEVGWNKRFAKQLLLYLLLNRSTTRENICEALWPNMPIQQARANLRVYLSHLRKLLTIPDSEYSFLIIDGSHVYLQGDIHCDVTTLLEQIREAMKERIPSIRQHLIDQLVQSLPIDLIEDTQATDWLLAWHTQLEEDIIELVLWNAQQYQKQKDYDSAIHQLKKALQFSPDMELYQCLIDTYEEIGNLDKAMKWRQRMKQFDHL